MRIGFFITARLKSSRLKRKILLDCGGKTVLDHVVERAKSTPNIDGVVLCTSTNPQDSELYSTALKHGVEFYIGSEDDVLQRNLAAAQYYGYEAFASTTADNPLFCIRAIDQVIQAFRETRFDFGFMSGLPIGCMPYFLRTDALRVACHMKTATDTEIWGPFVKRPDFFHISDFAVTGSPFDESYRLTCDYREDLELLRTIYKHMGADTLADLSAVFALLQEHPAWWQINADCEQRWPDEGLLKHIRDVFDSQVAAGRAFAESQGIRIEPGHTEVRINI
jgi:spore coat polysaccharide biosynthesis protein SpsF